MPLDLCYKIEVALNGFWWKGNLVGGRGIRWRNWKDLCKPKVTGGMGFRGIRNFNIALLGNKFGESSTTPIHLWQHFLKLNISETVPSLRQSWAIIFRLFGGALWSLNRSLKPTVDEG